MNQPIQGIFTPNIVPLEADGAINEPELRRYVDWLIAEGRARAVSQRIDRRVHPIHARRAAANHSDRLPTGGRPRPGAGRGGRGQRPRDARGLRALRRVRRPGRGHRVAVLLQAVSRVGVRLFSRDRAAHSHRRDALQHPHVRQSDRRAHHQAVGRVRADRGHQGFVGRHGVHDADDVGGAADPPRFLLPDRLGRGAGADAAARRGRRHQRRQPASPRN